MNRFQQNHLLANLKKHQEAKKKQMEASFLEHQKELEKKKGAAIKKGGEVKEQVEDFLFGRQRRNFQPQVDFKKKLLAKQAQAKELQQKMSRDIRSQFAFKNGGLLQQNFMELKMKKMRQIKKNFMKVAFEKKVEEIQNSLKIYDQKSQHKENILSMNNTVQNDTDEMAKKASFGLNTRNINNRMADWYEEQNEFFEWINYYLSKLYWLVVIGAFVLIYMKFKFENKKALGVIIGFIITPFLLNNLIYWIFGLNSNNCPTYIPSLGFEAGGSKTCQSKKAIIPVDCVMGSWSRCDKRCGGGTQVREVEMEAMNGGKACGQTSQKCNTQPCEAGETPTPPKKGVVKKDGDENVLIEMTKGLWQSFQSRLEGAKEKSENDMCRQQEQDNYNKKQADLFSAGSDKIKGMGAAAGDLFGKAKDMGTDALNKTKKLAADPKGTLNKLTDGAEDAINKAEGGISGAMKTTTDKADNYFNITSAPCVGKYCR